MSKWVGGLETCQVKISQKVKNPYLTRDVNPRELGRVEPDQTCLGQTCPGGLIRLADVLSLYKLKNSNK